MKNYKEFKYYFGEIEGQRKKIDNTIYSFDIETTSYIKLDNKIMEGIKYQELSKEEKEKVEFCSCMYEWTFSINQDVYYGRKWEELIEFLDRLELYNPEHKIVFVHNLSFEFQFLKSVFDLKDVMARKSRKVMRCFMEDYNIEFRCSYFMSNCKLSKLPEIYNLPVKKLVGDLDYTKIRTPVTELTEKELEYCEHDCLVVYY